MIQAFKTEYDKKTKQFWTLKENVFRVVRYINQNTSRGQFAYFSLLFELYKGEPPVVFENKTTLQKEFIGNKRFEEELKLYTNTIYKTIEEELNRMYLIGFPIIELKIVLSDLIIHPADSNELSYKIATQMTVKEVFKVDNLVRVSL